MYFRSINIDIVSRVTPCPSERFRISYTISRSDLSVDKKRTGRMDWIEHIRRLRFKTSPGLVVTEMYWYIMLKLFGHVPLSGVVFYCLLDTLSKLDYNVMSVDLLRDDPTPVQSKEN